MKGYHYSRDDVRGRALANANSQEIGDVFTRELKPLDVEVIVAEVGDPLLVGQEDIQIYRNDFDGIISDHSGYCVIGGADEELLSHLQSNYTANARLGEVLRLGRAALGRANDGSSMAPDQLEV
jgi:proteasome alpha subunit